MPKQGSRGKAVCAALMVAAFTLFAFAGSASAKLTGNFTKFQQCPWTTAGVDRCLWSQTTGGEVVLGSKTVPITNGTAVLQGGYTLPDGAGYSKFVGAKNGQTLTKAPQPVPGGLSGLVDCTKITIGFIREACKAVFENGVTGLDSTLELARPASDIRISELNLAFGEGVILKLPVRAHLENPFLGSECYVGSSGTPLQWELRTDTTSPPPPNKPITGKPGEFEFLNEGEIIEVKNLEFVDNAWSAPAASGCGGIFAFAINPVVNAAAGLPSAAGKNTARLKNLAFQTPAGAVKFNDESNP